MLNRSRRKFLAGSCASVLYGARASFATESPALPAPQIALLLPLGSPSFSRAAESVQQGFAAAAKTDAGTEIATKIYPTTDDPDSIASAYEQALAQGARLIVGPLTRIGVSRIAQNMQPGVPVLALNVPENDAPLPEDFYVFSLQSEAESRQLARMAYAEGRRSVLTVTDAQPLMRRIQKAFVDEFVQQGGKVVGEFAYRNTTADLTALREAATAGQCDTVFLALDSAHARLARPYVEGTAQVYATSQVLEGPPERLRDAELNGVRFVDMPWLLQADHPAVMIYARTGSSAPAASDFERLYAFGIDAYRIAADLLRGGKVAQEPLDGVTGRISLTSDRHFVRELTPAQFIDGRPVPLANGP
jgi:uncharacterized protein